MKDIRIHSIQILGEKKDSSPRFEEALEKLVTPETIEMTSVMSQTGAPIVEYLNYLRGLLQAHEKVTKKIVAPEFDVVVMKKFIPQLHGLVGKIAPTTIKISVETEEGDIEFFGYY